MKIWEGKYKDFKNAKKFAKGEGFSSKKWTDSQFKIFLDCKKIVFTKNKKLPNKYVKRYVDFLNIVKKIFKKNKKLNILDFGGGFGIGFFYIRQNLNKKKINYTIIENLNIINKFKSLCSYINYESKLNYKKKYDIVNCCSVFQYIENWKSVIKKLSSTKTNYIYFSDMFIGNIKSFVTLQNYYENKIPHWFINIDEFNNQLKLRGYKLVKKQKMITKRLGKKTILPMQNFKKENKIPYTLNLLYKRI